MFVAARAQAGRFDELVAWYRDHHLPEMRAVPGIGSVSQFRSVDDGPDGAPTLLTVYGFDSDEVDAQLARLAAVRPGMTPTTALADATTWVGRPTDSGRGTP